MLIQTQRDILISVINFPLQFTLCGIFAAFATLYRDFHSNNFSFLRNTSDTVDFTADTGLCQKRIKVEFIGVGYTVFPLRTGR